MKSWLMLRMAQDPELGIAAGIEFCFIETIVDRLTILTNDDEVKKVKCYQPTQLELALAIENTIINKAEKFQLLSKELRSQWLGLFDYLELLDGGRICLTKKKLRRTCALAIELAKLFVDYGIFGGKMLASWERRGDLGWQELLWKEMESLYCFWNYPYRKFTGLDFKKNIDPTDVQIHIFSLSYIPSIYHQFFVRAGKKIPVFYYILSPCQKFWSDILSEKESLRLTSILERQGVSSVQQIAMEEFITDTNPLLANFGRLGREMALQIESGDHLTNEMYALPDSVVNYLSYENLISKDIALLPSNGPLTLLEAVQADLALLRNPESSKKIEFDAFDETIQIHSAPKPMREVQVVYNTLLTLLEKHRKDPVPIDPSDIIILVPNLADYAPFIRSIFQGTESRLEFQLMDLQIPSRNAFIQGFLHLLCLSQGRWNAASLMRLFEYPSFQLRHRLSLEDIQQINSWIKEAGIRWGQNPSHRNELLKMDHCQKEMVEENWEGTWEHGLGRLIEGLVLSEEGENVDRESLFFPLSSSDVSQSVLLGRLLNLLRSLMSDLKPLSDQRRASLKEWSAYLKCLCEAYFECNKSIEEDLEGQRLLMDELTAFGKAGNKLEEALFPFSSIFSHLEQALQTQSINYREGNLQAVRFCSFLPMRTVPAKIVVLMGMGEKSFPRMESPISFNKLVDNSETDFKPKQMDVDRYMFLEALLSARRYFLMTFSSQNPGDIHEQPPSLFVNELLNYLDTAFSIGSGLPSRHCYYKHPFTPFNKIYFTEGGSIKSYGNSHYNAAKMHYCSQKQPQHSFLASFPLPACGTPTDEGEIVIELDSLAAYVKDPLKIYFNRVLEIYIENEDQRQIQNDEDFLLSNLDRSILIRKGIYFPVSEVIKFAENSGQLPKGPFKEIEKRRIQNEIEAIKAQLSNDGIDLEKIFSIEMSERFSGIHLWQLPPLRLNIPGLGRIKIIGRLDDISQQGMIIFKKDSLEELIKAWPKLLVFFCLIKRYQLPFALNGIFVDASKNAIKDAAFDFEIQLIHLLKYYLRAKNSLSPLLPECIFPILCGSTDKLHEVFYGNSSQDSFPIYNEYLKWLRISSPLIDMDSLIKGWQGTARELYADLIKVWHPTSFKKINQSQNHESV